MYHITDYTFRKAQENGVQVKPSKNKKKKIDVFRDGKKLASVGAAGMGDFGTFMKIEGKDYAEKRRRLYRMRHAKDGNIPNTPGYWAWHLLW